MVRSVARFILRAVGWLAAAGALLLLALWACGQVVSDRVHLLQFVAWAPAWMVLSPAAVCGVLAVLMRARAHDEGPRVWGRRGSRMVLGCVLGAQVMTVVFGMRVFNAFKPAGSGPALTLAHWNLDAYSARQWAGSYAKQLNGRVPDVFLLSSNQPWSVVEASLQALNPQYRVAHLGNFVVASTLPIVGARRFSLALAQQPVALDPRHEREKEMRAALEKFWNEHCQRFGISLRSFGGLEDGDLVAVRLDATATLGREITIYYLDLPSDPFESKWSIAEQTRTQLERLLGQKDEQTGKALLSPADIIAGDFNTPRGSASLGLIAPGMTHAFDQGGWGAEVSFPRTLSLLHIDHVFVAPWLRARRYETVQPEAGDHWMQWAEIVARE